MSDVNWEKLLNSMRLGRRAPKHEQGRSPFVSDHDKVVFSGAFRRLARKTQVHPLASNDHVHNRLTHSLEVACVGRSLGINVGYSLKQSGRLPDNIGPADIGDIVQAACLAHDIGNPPFGHTGEEVIRLWFCNDGKQYIENLTIAQQRDLTGFEGNAQGLRVLTRSEYFPDDGGMRLTYATLAAFIKYPWTSDSPDPDRRPKPNKYGVFQSEVGIFREIADAVGLHRHPGEDWYIRHPLVYLMEAADDFCYGLIDLEDGLEMGILKWDQVYEILEPLLSGRDKNAVKRELETFCDSRKPPIIRGKIIARCVESATTAFQRYENGIVQGQYDDLISLCDPEIRDYVENAKNLANREIFSHRRKVELEIGAYSAISTLLEVMCSAVMEIVDKPAGTPLSFRAKRIANLLGAMHPDNPLVPDNTELPDARYLALMRVVDFVSGMTDNYAVNLMKQFRGLGH